MWNSDDDATCPCPDDSDIPVIHVKVPTEKEKKEPVVKHITTEHVTLPTVSEEKEFDEEKEKFLPKKDHYEPSPYTFRMRCGAPYPGQQARSPPLWLLIDHTLAVIWSLFSVDKYRPIGIVQLQWTLAFLKGVINDRGFYSKDVEMCIRIIEDRLINQYAEMRYIVEDTPGKITEPCKISECRPCYKVPKEKENQEAKEESNDQFVVDTYKLQPVEDPFEMPTQFKCPHDTFKLASFSVTFNSVMKSKKASVHELFKAPGRSLDHPVSEDSFILKESTSTFNYHIPKSASKDEVRDYLNQWKQAEILRYKESKKRLERIEKLMDDINK